MIQKDTNCIKIEFEKEKIVDWRLWPITHRCVFWTCPWLRWLQLEALLKNTLLLPTTPPEAIVSTRMKTRVRLENSVCHTDEHQVTPVHKWRVWNSTADTDRRKRAYRALSNKTKCTISALPALEIVRGYNNELTGGLGFGQRFYWRRPLFCVISQSINFTAELKWRLECVVGIHKYHTSTGRQ